MAAQLSLQDCTIKSCPRCDIGYIIAHFVKPLMQCLTNDIKDFNMQLLTTKCLNTAVMIMFFMLGSKGLSHANHCDSRAVFDRKEDKASVLASMRKKILRKSSRHRHLYYILMNDADFPYPTDAKKEDAFFPGHVFVLEKIPGHPTPSYYLYQSYINKYDLNGYISNTRDKSLHMTYEQVEELLTHKLAYILTGTTTWDKKCVQYWKEFTHVDTSDIFGSITEGKLFICCQSSPVKNCVSNIETYVNNKLAKLQSLSSNATYGNTTRYHASQTPLTNAQMYEQLSQIQKLIQLYKKRPNT